MKIRALFLAFFGLVAGFISISDQSYGPVAFLLIALSFSVLVDNKQPL